MPVPIQYDSAHLDLSARVFSSATVVASPALAAETIICSVTCTGDIAIISGIIVMGWCAFTVGTSGVSAQMKIRRTNVSGATQVDTGATNNGVLAATQLASMDVQAFDTGPAMPGQVYVLTLQIASGAAASTVSGANLIAIAI